MGVSQGTVLGPVSFSIYINNLGWELNKTKVNLFADDTILYTAAATVKDAITHLHLLSIRYKHFSLG